MGVPKGDGGPLRLEEWGDQVEDDEVGRSVADVPAFFSALYANSGCPATIDPLRAVPMPGNAVGCGAFAATLPDGNRVVGKNLDWKRAPILLLRTNPPNGSRALYVVDLSLCDIFGIGESPYALLTAPYVPFDSINPVGTKRRGVSHIVGQDVRR